MLHPGLRLGERYRLGTRIGAGGMGEVWRAVDEVLDRVVAVKAMLPDVAAQPDLAKRFLVEAKAMASVSHHAVASIHDFGHGAGITFLVMEFIDGESLAQLLARTGRLAPEQVMRLVAQAADGLRAVHERGIVHRDIKPANLLIRRDGALLITDFGISRTQDGTQLTASGAVLGTPTYLSPEQVLGQPATGLSDIYSLGLAAYECLAGHRPFSGDNPYAVALQRLQTPPRPLDRTLPGPVLAVVERALAADPADRWPSAAAMADAARAAAQPTRGHYPPAVGHSPPPAAPPAPPPRVTPPPVSFPAPERRPSGSAQPRRPKATAIRRRWALIAAVVALAVGGGAVVWQARDPGGERGTDLGAPPAGAATGSAAGLPRGFVACGPVSCPAQPMCWAGLTADSGHAASPRDVDCAASHRWETFAAFPLPADVSATHEDELLERADVKDICTATVMASHSRDSSATEGWRVTAWPVQAPDTGARFVHCLAQPTTGESSTSAFAAPG